MFVQGGWSRRGQPNGNRVRLFYYVMFSCSVGRTNNPTFVRSIAVGCEAVRAEPASPAAAVGVHGGCRHPHNVILLFTTKSVANK